MREIVVSQAPKSLPCQLNRWMARRLRIVAVQPDPDDPDRALVTFVIDTYSRGGPFGAGSTWSREVTVEVVREEGAWKINAQEFFF